MFSTALSWWFVSEIPQIPLSRRSVYEIAQILTIFTMICVWITTNTYHLHKDMSMKTTNTYHIQNDLCIKYHKYLPLTLWSVSEKYHKYLPISLNLFTKQCNYNFHNNPRLNYHKYVPLSRRSVSGRIRCIWQNRGSFSDCSRSCTYRERRRPFWTLWLDVPDLLLPGEYTGAN